LFYDKSQAAQDTAVAALRKRNSKMTQTISIVLDNRFRDAERVINLISRTGCKIEEMTLKNQSDDSSKLVIVADAGDQNIESLLRRLREQIRVTSVEHMEGDELTSELEGR
jgi:acetolactate synthase small subunit